MGEVDPKRFEAACARFVEFFAELGKTFVEREELLAQIALALLGREHVLMTGPPGTAKSGIASAVLRRVVDESSRMPSIYARQFTESTVQTDLVGPINFKTLMDTGRTEHFTDEGMLGSVHAFLDEVFDGRDMLLRSTLNVLQERELKQGGKTTRGRIECALMTTNRYLAEVLEGSRETLLAFVDRIAFVSFVPKSFASPLSLGGVLKKQLGPGNSLYADLTIQDLDVLQAVVDDVVVPDQVCESLSKLLGALDVEFAAAERSDPHFLPTRYLSTRTAVRLGKMLRAVTVYDRLFYNKDRELEAGHGDLAGLRLSLLLGGPLPQALALLLKKETDARERRQLAIIRTEREIFDRCLAKLPAPPLPQKTKKSGKVARAVADEAHKLRSLATSMETQPTQALVAATVKLATQVDAPPLPGTESRKLLEGAVGELSARALRAGMMAPGAIGDADALDVAEELGALADQVESAAGATRPIARWLRGRAIALVDDAVRLGTTPRGAALDAGSPRDSVHAMKLVSPVLERAERLFLTRKRLVSQGADEPDGGNAWDRACERLEADVALLIDSGFRADVESAMAQQGDELEAVVLALAGPLDMLAACATRVAVISKKPSTLKSQVTGPRLRPLVANAFERIGAPDRVKLVAQVQQLLTILSAASLEGMLPPKDILSLTAAALVRSASMAPRTAEAPLDRATYRKMRAQDQRVPGAFTLLEIAIKLAPSLGTTGAPEDSARALAEIARDLSPEIATAVAKLDADRLERAVRFMERWWAALASDEGSAPDRVRAWTTSKFFHVAHDEQALVRTALECKLVTEVFPQMADEMDKLVARLEALDTASTAAISRAVRERGDLEWEKTLGKDR